MIADINIKRFKGLWFYGLAGSGKSFASQFLKPVIANSFVIDGDVVREYISTDLAYSVEDRTKQIFRIFGIGKIAIINNKFPIMSSVSMSDNMLKTCDREDIAVVLIKRPMEQLKIVRHLYTSENNVVGVDLPLANLDTLTLENDGTKSFEITLTDYAKSFAT